MPDRPNSVLILTDQQSATMMGCAGNSHVNTPAMDSLANAGMRFDRAYCTNPACVPSRFSVMTGHLPGGISLRSGENADNTVVVFTSDHGDQDSSHKLEHKTAFYEEACRIPLIISQPGVTETGVCSDLVSNGLDLLPTLCDYAGTEPPEGLPGRPLKPLAGGVASPTVQESVPLENEFGRMVVTERFKYMLHDDGEHREQLIDLENDPGETQNALHDGENSEALAQCRALFAEQFG